MNEHSMRDAYEQSLRARDQVGQSAELPLDRLESLVAREGSEADRLRALDVAMSSAEGRREFEIAWAAARAAREPQRRFTVPRWVSAAAVLTLAVGLGVFWNGQSQRADATERMRGVESPVELVSPRGDQVRSLGERFAWHRVTAAREYTLVIVDRAGNEVFASSTTDTVVQLPDSVRLRAGTQYLWWVQAHLPDGTQLSAVTETITVPK